MKYQKCWTSLSCWMHLLSGQRVRQGNIVRIFNLRTNLPFPSISFQNSATSGEIVLYHIPKWVFVIISCAVCSKRSPVPTNRTTTRGSSLHVAKYSNSETAAYLGSSLGNQKYFLHQVKETGAWFKKDF